MIELYLVFINCKVMLLKIIYANIMLRLINCKLSICSLAEVVGYIGYITQTGVTNHTIL